MDLPVPVGSVLANKYRVDRFIGAGGMGVVAAGFHLELDQPIAIKFLSPDMGFSGEGAERFRREGRAAARIRSEHVVRVLDIGLLDERQPYMVMELLEGTDLEQELLAHGPLPVETAVSYVLQAIDAIAEAHAAGIVHRDLKPTNLFLSTTADGSRKIKVLDFGISKFTTLRLRDAELTRTSSMVGSPLYMAPEQMRSARDVDARADIWSLGAILFELITGQLPFVGDSIPSLCVSVMSDPPRSAASFVPSTPRELEFALERCLSKSLPDRFQSVAELAEALVAFAPAFRPHAERARRLLARTSLPSVTPTSADARRMEVPTRVSPTPIQVTPNGSQSPVTGNSWGRTDGNVMSKRSIPILVGVAALAAAAVLAFLFLRTPQTQAPTSVSAPTVQQAIEAARAEVAPAPAAVPAAQPASPAASVVALSPESTATVGVVPVEAPAASTKPQAPKAVIGAAARAPARSVPRPPRAPTNGSQVTDFGGRYY